MKLTEEQFKQAAARTVELADEVELAHSEWRRSRIYTSPPRSNRASELGHPCLRYLVAARLHGDKLTGYDERTQGIFDQGNMINDQTIEEFRKAGFEAIHSERPFFDNERQIAGRIDIALKALDAGHTDPTYPTEIKSMQSATFDQIRPGLDGIRDLLRSRSWWVRKYPFQLASYLHMTGEPGGLLALRCKASWRLRVLPMPRGEKIVEELIERALSTAETVNEHVARGELPDRIPYDASICGRCSYYDECLPPRVGEGIEWVESPELVERLRERENLAEPARRFKQLSEALKIQLRAYGELVVVGGEFEIKNTVYTVKRKGAEPSEACRTTIRQLGEPRLPFEKVEVVKEGNP